MDSLTIILLIICVGLLLLLHITCSVVANHVAARKGRSGRWFGFLGLVFGLFGVMFAKIAHARTFIWNPELKKELMYITFLHQYGALTDVEFEREKKVIYWMNEYFS